jgi:hypothetical protein
LKIRLFCQFSYLLLFGSDCFTVLCFYFL